MSQSTDRQLRLRSFRNNLLALGILLSLFFWVFESGVMVVFFNDGTFLNQVFNPDAHEIWHRALVAIFIIGFAFHATHLLSQRLKAHEKIAAGEEQHQRLVDLSPNGVAIITDERIAFINDSGVSLFGAKSLRQLLGKPISALIPPEHLQAFRRECLHLVELGKKGRRLEIRIERLDRQRLDVETVAVPFNYEGATAHLTIFRDITDRKLAESQLHRRNEELAAMNIIASAVGQSLDLNAILNDALTAVLGLNFLGGHASGLLLLREPRTDRLRVYAHQGISAAHPCLIEPVKLGECLCGTVTAAGTRLIGPSPQANKTHTRTCDGMDDHQDFCLPLSAHGETFGAMNIQVPRDVQLGQRDLDLLETICDQIGVAVQNARLFEASDRQGQLLRSLSARLSEVEASERQNLARELHDQVGQNLTALGINLSIVSAQLPDLDHGQAAVRLSESLSILENTTERIRNVMTELRPPVLDDYGLVASLEWYGGRISRRSGCAVKVIGLDSNVDLPQNVENALFRIAQEALTNVCKHANASTVKVSLESNGDTARMVVEDDGIGFNPDQSAIPGADTGWGLLIMAERAELLGGHCRVESRPDMDGTRVTIEVSL